MFSQFASIMLKATLYTDLIHLSEYITENAFQRIKERETSYEC